MTNSLLASSTSTTLLNPTKVFRNALSARDLDAARLDLAGAGPERRSGPCGCPGSTRIAPLRRKVTLRNVIVVCERSSFR